LAVPFAVAAWPLVIGGAFINDRLALPPLNASIPKEASEQPPAPGLSPAVARLTGLVLGMIGAGILFATLALAWPRPAPLILIGFLNAAVLAGVALGFRLPYAHGPALAFLTVGYLTAFHGLRGDLTGDEAILGEHLVKLAISPASGTALAILAAIMALSSEFLFKAKRHFDGLHHVVAAGIAGLTAMLLVSLAGNAEPGRAAMVFMACGLGAILTNLRLRQPWLTVLATIVLLGSMAYTIHWWTPDLPIARLMVLALLSHATILGLMGICLQRWSQSHPHMTEAFVEPVQMMALITSLLALLPLLGRLEWTGAGGFVAGVFLAAPLAGPVRGCSGRDNSGGDSSHIRLAAWSGMGWQ
jgi:hypothetical protein